MKRRVYASESSNYLGYPIYEDGHGKYYSVIDDRRIEADDVPTLQQRINKFLDIKPVVAENKYVVMRTICPPTGVPYSEYYVGENKRPAKSYILHPQAAREYSGNSRTPPQAMRMDLALARAVSSKLNQANNLSGTAKWRVAESTNKET